MTKALLAIVVLITAAAAEAQTSDCGRAVDGVQMCLQTSGSNLRLAFANVGKQDVTLNLGIMLANGRIQFPTHVALKFTDAAGKTRVFHSAETMYVAGRVDDYV